MNNGANMIHYFLYPMRISLWVKVFFIQPDCFDESRIGGGNYGMAH